MTTVKRKRSTARKRSAVKKTADNAVKTADNKVEAVSKPDNQVYVDPLLNVPGIPQPPSAIAEKMGKPDRFPDRKVNIEEIDDYEWKDPTLLMKNGVPWIPEEHGWRSRFCTNEARKHKGLGIWRKVRPEDGIVFADAGVEFNQSQGARVEDGMFGEAGDGVYRNGAFLCLAPLEQAIAKEQRQLKDAHSIVEGSMLHSAEQIQGQTGGDPNISRFALGPKMGRHKVRIPNEELIDRAKYHQSGRRSVTVPAKIS